MNIPQEPMEAAVKKIEEIKNSTDKEVRYRDMRPIATIRHMFESSVEAFSDRTAFYVKDVPGGPYREVTYKEAKTDVDALGTQLIKLGLKGKRIAVISDNRYEWAVTYLAVTGGIGVIVPLDKELPGNELVELVKEADVSAVIFSEKYRGIFWDAKSSGQTKLEVLIDMDEAIDSEEVLSFKRQVEAGKIRIEEGNRSYLDSGGEIDPKAMSILLYTSGTTGVAKGVMLSHENICEDLMSMVSLIKIVKEDIFFSVLPIHHTYECTCGFLCPIYRGAAVAYCEGLRHIVKNLGEVKPTVILAVPLLFESLYKKIWSQAKKSGMEKKLRTILKINRATKKVKLDLVPLLLKKVTDVFGGRMRLMISGGASIDPAIIEGINDFGIIALQGYGLTECGPIGALNPDINGRPGAAGRAMPHIELKIHEPDEEGIGEVCVRGKNVMMGYYNNQAATDAVMEDGWFHTGDLGYIDKDGYLFITGREKNVIITKNGKNVYPEEIEYYLSQIPYVEECIVWGKDSEESGETLIFAAIRAEVEEVEEVLGKEYTDQQLEELLWAEIDTVNSRLPYFKRIKKISVRKTDFEKTTGKKIKRFVEDNKK